MQIKQVRYYSKDLFQPLNFPTGITTDQLANGSFFSESKEIMIRATEGLKFAINGAEVAIGPAEIYNIPLEENVKIESLKLIEDSTIGKRDWYAVITFVLNKD
jgi:hypothetical protein